MKNLRNKVNDALLSLYLKLTNFHRDEEGLDVIVTIVLIAIGLVIVAVIIGYWTSIRTSTQAKVDSFNSAFSGV